jgi:tetratricopeptide (TPR) repeat protein
MKFFKLLFTLALAPVLFNAQLLHAQSVTVLSGGGDARACSFAAELSVRLDPARSDLDACNRALEHDSLTRHDRAATFVNRGILLAGLDKYQDALNDYNEALEIQPGLPQAWVGKGNLYFLAERFNEAIDAYDTALELNLPERHAAYFNLGLVYEKMGDDAMAVQSYNRALEFVPDWAPARDKLQKLQTGRAPPSNG